MEFANGQMLDERLRVKRRLGEGGFGIVYEARDEQLNRDVAVKVLKQSLVGDLSVRKRFLREGKILAAVKSDFLVQLLSVNINTDGMLYMVMELLEGRSLRAELNEAGSLSEEDTSRIAYGVATALSILSDNGVVHRDLKPDNIMLVRDENVLTVKVLDFGLSALIDKASVKDSFVTEVGTMLGSVHYVAPELCIGESARFQSDCYSLGCSLYECVTGEPPFAQSDSAAVIFQKSTTPPPDPGLRVPQLSLAMRQLIMRLLQIDPERRYKDPSELLGAIDLLSSGANSAGSPRMGSARASTLKLSSRSVAITLALLVLGTIGLSFYGNWSLGPVESRPKTDRIDHFARMIVSDRPFSDTGWDLVMVAAEQVDSSMKSPSDAQSLKQINSDVTSLISCLDQEKSGLTVQQYDSVRTAMNKLSNVNLRKQELEILVATINCLARGLPAQADTDLAIAQINEAFNFYYRVHSLRPPTKPLLDYIASGLVARGTSRVCSMKELSLEMTLCRDYIVQKYALPAEFKELCLKRLNEAPVAVLAEELGILNTMVYSESERKDVKTAKRFASLVLRGIKHAGKSSNGRIAYLSLGNALESVDMETSGKAWARSVEMAEQLHTRDQLYLDALGNSVKYQLYKHNVREASFYINKLYRGLCDLPGAADGTKVWWFSMCEQLPDKAEREKMARVISSVLNEKRGSPFSITGPKDQVEGFARLVHLLRCLGEAAEAARQAEIGLNKSAGRGNIPRAAIYVLKLEFARALVEAGRRKQAADVYKQLLLPSAGAKESDLAILRNELKSINR